MNDDGSMKRSRRKRLPLWHNLTKGRRNKNKVNNLNEGHHLTIDQLVAKRKLEQLKLITRTDLNLLNSAEPFRVSSYILFERNLLDPILYITIALVYSLSCLLMASNQSTITFMILFIILFYLLNYHIESYRSFVVVRKSLKRFINDPRLRKTFLGTNLVFNPRLERFNNNRANQLDCYDDNYKDQRKKRVLFVDEPEMIDDKREDTFHWINRIIVFFWPYLSHLIHYELNEFFRDQIESGSLARSDEGAKRLFYAIIRQLDTNILVIEKCQLGKQSPLINNLRVIEGKDKQTTNRNSLPFLKIKPISSKDPSKRIKTNKVKTSLSELFSPPKEDYQNDINVEEETTNKGKTLIYDIDLEYNGDMNISVIYRYFCCCSSRFGLKDVFLHFNLRIVLGPFKEQVPFFDQVTFTLLELPDFGYRGIALAELAELKIVRSVINKLIRENMLNPKKLTISLGALLETLINGPKSKEDRKEVSSKGTEGLLSKQTLEHRRAESSRIEPHPGKINFSASTDLDTSTTRLAQVKDTKSSTNKNNDSVSFGTKLMANTLLCGCMCSNFLLRCCQPNRTDGPKQTIQEIRPERKRQ